jgi:negative regulator of sigma E activity
LAFSASVMPRNFCLAPLASIIAGGPAPLIATALLAAYHNWVAIAAYMTACALVSVVAAALMRDYTNQDISEEYDRPA